MKLYFQSTRNNQTIYSSYDGMNEATILSLMADLGHTDIETVTLEEFLTATNPGE